MTPQTLVDTDRPKTVQPERIEIDSMMTTPVTQEQPTFIPFNKPYIVGSEATYIHESLANGKLSGDGPFTKRCEQYFQSKYGFPKALLTTSCTDALEMAAILMDLKPGDEVIIPSYTFVSTANAFVLHGAKVVFADSEPHSPNIDVTRLEKLITPRTRGIVVVHYAGISCEMQPLMALAAQHNLIVVEDAAHAIDASYQSIPLGRFGHLATFSFHETKNIVCGEGGLLGINDPAYIKRAEIIREKGTDRSAFFRGEVDKYSWRDIGSSFLPADYVAAFLWGQLDNMDQIQSRRMAAWRGYYQQLAPLAETGCFQVPHVPTDAVHNAHLFYLVCRTSSERAALMAHLKAKNIQTTFHYLPLHESPCYLSQPLEMRAPADHIAEAVRYGECLVRLPLHAHLTEADVNRICQAIIAFYQPA